MGILIKDHQIEVPHGKTRPVFWENPGLRFQQFWFKILFAWLIAALPLALAAADFTVGGGSGSPAASGQPAQAPVSGAGAGDDGSNPVSRFSRPEAVAGPGLMWDAGDAPTAYLLNKYEVKTDLRFYESGGILGKAYLGLFPWLTIGGGANAENVIGSGDVTMTRDDAMVLARLQLLRESDNWPALALGWDGPAYSFVPTRGLYLAASKEIRTSLGYCQIHGSLNTARFADFKADQDLEGALAFTSVVSLVTLFTEFDDAFNPQGGYLNAGFRVNLDPINIGFEFRDLGARHGPVFRLLRVGYIGLF